MRSPWRRTLTGLAMTASLLAAAFPIQRATAGRDIAATPAHPASATPPHVLVVMLENKGYPGTLGKCASDPYLCSLAARYASDTTWYAVGHPSLPNYLAVTTGSTQGCAADSCKGPYSPSLGGQLETAGIPWVAWEESMPAACDSNDRKPYTHHHNPFTYESDSNCAARDVPYPGITTALTVLDGSTPPDFVWLGPDNTHNMHQSQTVTSSDAWLRANIDPILNSPWFTGGNATVVITMDEYEKNNVNGGGQIPMVVVSANASGVGNVATPGNQFGLLRTIEEAFGLAPLAAAAVLSNGDLSSLFG